MPGNGYTVAYSVTSQWDGAFNGSVTIKNTSGTALNGWSLAWTYAGNQKVVNIWSGKVTQKSQNVVVTNESYNPSIPAGGTVTFGFQATNSGTYASPANFTFNGVAVTPK